MEENRPLVCYCKGGIDSVVDKLTKIKISHPMVDPLLRDLQSLRADLVNKFAGGQAEHKQVKAWMKQIRDLVYDIEDWVDIKLTTNMGESEMVTEQIEEFKTKLMGARSRCKRYDLINKVPPSITNPIDTAPSNKVAVHSRLISEEKAVLVGVSGPQHKLEEHLKGQQKKRKVVCILGAGGHGKTTLGKEVYEKLKGQFECHASVTVGRNSCTNVLKEVLLQVTDPKNSRAFKNEQEVNIQLWEFLQTKRYLVFMDDICNTQAWSVINSVLPYNDLGSRVLTTTRIKDVAMSCTIRSTDVVYEMEGLDENDSSSLLLRTISTEKELSQVDINKICHDMIKISRGLPLSIIVTAGLIARKLAEWGIQGKHGECCLSALDQHSTSEGMKKVLEICFADLSPPLKSCFVYMSAFPENYTIRKDRLVWRWISEGFIPKRSRAESLWETAESYFNELVCRKLIRPEFDDYDDDMAVSCTVQCVIHDFITSLSRQENFLTTATELISRPFPCGTIRRFSVNCSRQDVNEADSLVSSSVHLSRIRSLIVFGGSRRVSDLSIFKHLRVLDLEDNSTVDNQQLESIGLLSLLRYLGLAGTNVDKLPHQTIMALKYLVTLDLRRTRVIELPVARDTELVSVLADGLKLPRGIREMKQLEELSTVSLFPEDGAWLLSNSKRLRMLGVTFGNMHVPIENNQPGMEDFLEQVGKSKLQSFLLDEYPCNAIELLADCWDGNRPHCLRKFELRMSNYLRVIPEKMASMIALTHLHIRVEQVQAQVVHVLGSLPNLVLLKLFSCNGSQGRLTISSKDDFRCLKVFSFSCSINFGMGLRFGKGAMRQLRRLHIDFSARETKYAYGDFDFGIQHLYGLIEVRAIIRCHNAEASEVEAAKAAIRDQASLIPHNVLKVDLPSVALPSKYTDSRNKEIIRTDRCSTSVVVTRISTLPESSSPVPIPGLRNTKVPSALSRAVQDGYVSYPWDKKMNDTLCTPMSSCYFSMLVLPMALGNNACGYESFDATLARAKAWFNSSQASGIPINFMNVQSEALLTKISGETASASMNSGSFSDLPNVTTATLYTIQDYHGVNIGVVKTARLWYSCIGGELLLEIPLEEGDTKLGFAISRSEEGFIYISSVVEGHTPSTRSGLCDLFSRAKKALKLLIISRVSNEKVLPWMMSSSGAVCCFDTILLAQKLSLHRQTVRPIQLHLFAWEKPSTLLPQLQQNCWI